MSIAIYVRVSKSQQDTASQELDLKKWASAQTEPVQWFLDKMSGKTMDRPSYNRMMDQVNTGLVQSITVWRLDRLGRTSKGLVTLFDDLQARKVNLVSLRDGLDLSTPTGRLMAGVLASVAQYETEVRAERIHAGLEVARAEGKKLGPAVGSRKGKRLHLSPERVENVNRLHSEGIGVTDISKATGLSRPTIYGIINTPTTSPLG